MKTPSKLWSLALAALVLPFTAFAADGPACTVPGITIADDAAGDATDLPVSESTPVSQQVLNAEDILKLSVAEPASLTNRLVFTLKVADLSALPPAERWVVYFSTFDPDQTEHDWYVAMSTADVTQADAVTPTFEYGTYSTLGSPEVNPGTFAMLGSLDPASTFNADGTITFVVDPTPFNAHAGTELDNIFAKTRRSTSDQTQNMGLTNDDTLDNVGSYTMVGNSSCGNAKSGLLGLGALPLSGLLVLGALAGLRRRAR